jgi:hypothetical protein
MLGLAWPVVPAWCTLWAIGFLLLRSVNPASAAACVVAAAAAILLPERIVAVVAGTTETFSFRVFLVALMLVLLARLTGETRTFIAERRKARAAAGRR